jgi:hypothetical protein
MFKENSHGLGFFLGVDLKALIRGLTRERVHEVLQGEFLFNRQVLEVVLVEVPPRGSACPELLSELPEEAFDRALVDELELVLFVAWGKTSKRDLGVFDDPGTTQSSGYFVTNLPRVQRFPQFHQNYIT